MAKERHEEKKHEGLLKKGHKRHGFGKKAHHEKMAEHMKSAKKY